jgi:hypothetical protein
MTIAALEQPGGALASPFQASPTALTSYLTAVFPGALIAPCVVALFASNLLPSVPVSLGAAAGVLGWIGTANLVHLLWVSWADRAALLVVGLSAAIGTCLGMLVWASLGDVGDGRKEDLNSQGQGQDLPLLLRQQSSGGHVEGVPARVSA